MVMHMLDNCSMACHFSENVLRYTKVHINTSTSHLEDGFSTVKYTVEQITLKRLFTHIKVAPGTHFKSIYLFKMNNKYISMYPN